MKIAILGAGSIGTLFAAKIISSKLADVFVHSRGEHAAKLAIEGICVKGVEDLQVNNNEFHLSIEGIGFNNVFDKSTDYIFISSKANDVEKLLNTAKRLAKTDTKIMILSNGLGHIERCVEVFGPHRVIATTTTHGAWRPQPGIVQWAGKGSLNLGKIGLGPGVEDISDLINVLEKSSLNPIWQEDGFAMIWEKVLLNISINPVAAITGLPNGGLLESKLFEICLGVMFEGAKIARLEGISISDNETLTDSLNQVLLSTSENNCSMLQDVRNGSLTEINFLNGEIVQKAENYGVTTPLNHLLSTLIGSITSF